MWEVQTAFERQNEIPFGILWLGKQLGFILDVGCVRVCVWMRASAAQGIIQAWFGQKEENALKGLKSPV